MIKFVVAGLWLCAVTIGAVFYSFQSSASKGSDQAAPALLGGLDYVKTDVISVPIIGEGGVTGYFLAKLVYTVEPARMNKLALPAQTLFSDELYSFLFSNPNVDFTKVKTLDIDGFRNSVRDHINKRVGEQLIHDVLVEQIDFLTKEDIRNNMLRRIGPGSKPRPAPPAQADHGATSEEPSGQ